MMILAVGYCRGAVLPGWFDHKLFEGVARHKASGELRLPLGMLGKDKRDFWKMLHEDQYPDFRRLCDHTFAPDYGVCLG